MTDLHVKDGDMVHGHDLPLWAYKCARRLLTLTKPGVYAVALIVSKDGRRELIISNNKREMLGR